MKGYNNKIALFKSVLKTVMDPPGGLKSYAAWKRLGYDIGRYVMVDCPTRIDQLHLPNSGEWRESLSYRPIGWLHCISRSDGKLTAISVFHVFSRVSSCGPILVNQWSSMPFSRHFRAAFVVSFSTSYSAIYSNGHRDGPRLFVVWRQSLNEDIFSISIMIVNNVIMK